MDEFHVDGMIFLQVPCQDFNPMKSTDLRKSPFLISEDSKQVHGFTLLLVCVFNVNECLKVHSVTFVDYFKLQVQNNAFGE